MSGVQTDCKVYVNVRAAFLPDGKMLPEELTWEDGTPYTIDRILNVKPSVARKAGGQGDCYTILVKYSLQGTTQGRYLTGDVPPVRFSM